jgi:hypothetical protein
MALGERSGITPAVPPSSPWRRCAGHGSSIFLGNIDTLPLSIVRWGQKKPPADCGWCGGPMARVKKAQNKSSGANLGFEATLWAAEDKLRGQLDAGNTSTSSWGSSFSSISLTPSRNCGPCSSLREPREPTRRTPGRVPGRECLLGAPRGPAALYDGSSSKEMTKK